MAMNNSILTFMVLLVGFFVLCKGQEDTSIGPMEKNEQEALYAAIQGFVGKSWNGSDLYPDPCGWTPIQVQINPKHINSLSLSLSLSPMEQS